MKVFEGFKRKNSVNIVLLKLQIIDFFNLIIFSFFLSSIDQLLGCTYNQLVVY